MSFGRHMGTVWPQIQGFWAEAAARAAHADVFGHEFFSLVAHAVRDKHFAEIYHGKVRLEQRKPLRVAFVRHIGPYQECGGRLTGNV